ncbi:hypothetical protein Bbelb_021260 [Branchiostoma belcheri]|nr:hypothetical protein Bbelb_021260 [Branchiostoma belcheri]
MYRLNQNRGVYRNGAAYGNEKRLAILRSYMNNNGCYVNTAREHYCSENYVKKVVSRFVTTGELEHRQGHGGGGQRAPEFIRIYLEDDLQLQDVDTPSESTICRWLAEDRLTLKRAARVPMERYTVVNIERRRAFVRWCRHVNPADVYFDETGFNFQTDRRNQGRAPEGHVLPQVGFNNPGQKWSALATVGWDGLVNVLPIQGNFNREVCNNCFQIYKAPFMRRQTYLVMDNASIHYEADLQAIFAPLNITIVKLPPYSYDFNPILMVFGLVKARLQRTPGAIAENPALAIVDGFLTVSPDTIRNFYRRCWRAEEGA